MVHPRETEIQTLRFRAEALRDELSEPVQVAAANPGGVSGSFLGPSIASSFLPPQFSVTSQSLGQPQSSIVPGKRPATDGLEGQPGPSNVNKRRIGDVDLPVAGQDVAGPSLHQLGRGSKMGFQMSPHSRVLEQYATAYYQGLDAEHGATMPARPEDAGIENLARQLFRESTTSSERQHEGAGEEAGDGDEGGGD
jgi:hypothetical protein